MVLFTRAYAVWGGAKRIFIPVIFVGAVRSNCSTRESELLNLAAFYLGCYRRVSIRSVSIREGLACDSFVIGSKHIRQHFGFSYGL